MRIVLIRKKIRTFVIIFCMSLFLCLLSCSTRQGPIRTLADLTEEVQTNGSNYSEENWRAVAKELDAIESEMQQYKGEYTDEELKEIGRLKGILLAQYTKYSIKSIKNGVESTIKEVEGVIDGFMKSFSSKSSE